MAVAPQTCCTCAGTRAGLGGGGGEGAAAARSLRGSGTSVVVDHWAVRSTAGRRHRRLRLPPPTGRGAARRPQAVPVGAACAALAAAAVHLGGRREGRAEGGGGGASTRPPAVRTVAALVTACPCAPCPLLISLAASASWRREWPLTQGPCRTVCKMHRPTAVPRQRGPAAVPRQRRRVPACRSGGGGRRIEGEARRAPRDGRPPYCHGAGRTNRDCYRGAIPPPALPRIPLPLVESDLASHARGPAAKGGIGGGRPCGVAMKRG